jgi:methionine-rich copper-binding protein CopC
MSKPTPRRIGLLAAIVVAVIALFAAPAAAHAELKKSTPAKDSTVQAPSEVSLVFTERVQLARVKVSDAAGKDFQSGTPRVTGDTVTQALSGGLASGRYEVAYRVVSADGHPVEGTVPFKVAGGQNAAAPAASAAPGNQQGGDGQAPPASNTSTAGGGKRWLMVGAGLLFVAGIGLAIMYLRRGKETTPSRE